MCQCATCGQGGMQSAAKKGFIMSIVTVVYACAVMIIAQTPERAYCRTGGNEGEFSDDILTHCGNCDADECYDWDDEKGSSMYVGIVLMVVFAAFAFLMNKAKKPDYKASGSVWMLSAVAMLVAWGCMISYGLYAILMTAAIGWLLMWVIGLIVLFVMGWQCLAIASYMKEEANEVVTAAQPAQPPATVQ
jgi:hypothetical protein